MRKRPLLLIASVFLTGLVCQKYSCLPLVIWIALLLGKEIWIGVQNKKFRKIAGRNILLLSAFLLGIFYMHKETSFRNAYMSKLTDGSRVTVWGELIKLESVEYGNRGILSDCYIDFGEGVIPCNDVMVYTSNDHYTVGQIYKIIGKVNMFASARNEGNFDARVYYQSLKIDFAMEEEGVVLLQDSTDGVRSKILGLKAAIGKVYERCFSEKAAGFYQAMVLGDRMDLDGKLKELFLLGGISHILAISGLHISILGRGLYRGLRHYGVGFGIAGVCGSLVVISYCVMVGNSVSTVRAAGMLLFFFLAQWMGRSYDMLNALGGMVGILLWDNPFLIENSGFWFSVTAILGVGIVAKVLPDGIGTSLGITLATLPITAMVYYEVPVYSTLVNGIVLPLLPPVFCFAVLGGVAGVLIVPKEWLIILLQPCEWLLQFYEWICNMVARLPGANVICGKPEWWQMVLYYGILLAGVYGLRFLKIKKKDEHISGKRFAGTVMIAFLCMVCIFLPKTKNFEITFLDVGQGDGIYLCAEDGTTFFVDGGSQNVNAVGLNRILPFFKSKGVRKIDYWFVSHCDTDHISGLLEIIEKGYKIEHIVLPETGLITEKQRTLIERAKEKGIEVIGMKRGERICSSTMEMKCLAPMIQNGVAIGADENENSLVLQVKWQYSKQRGTALLAGDISAEIEKALCESGLLEDVDLVKANHHGSNYSNCGKWFETIQPEYIVVSCSKHNVYGHPGKKAVQRMEDCGAQIFYTMDGGQITFPLIK